MVTGKKKKKGGGRTEVGEDRPVEVLGPEGRVPRRLARLGVRDAPLPGRAPHALQLVEAAEAREEPLVVSHREGEKEGSPWFGLPAPYTPGSPV